MPLLKVTNRYSAWQREWALRITEVHVLAFHQGATEDTEESKPRCTFIQNTRFQTHQRLEFLSSFPSVSSVAPW